MFPFFWDLDYFTSFFTIFERFETLIKIWYVNFDCIENFLGGKSFYFWSYLLVSIKHFFSSRIQNNFSDVALKSAKRRFFLKNMRVLNAIWASFSSPPLPNLNLSELNYSGFPYCKLFYFSFVQFTLLLRITKVIFLKKHTICWSTERDSMSLLTYKCTNWSNDSYLKYFY